MDLDYNKYYNITHFRNVQYKGLSKNGLLHKFIWINPLGKKITIKRFVGTVTYYPSPDDSLANTDGEYSDDSDDSLV